MDSTSRQPDRVLLALVAVVATLVLAAVIAVLTRGEPAELEPDSPEGVVQLLTNAMIDSDPERARALVADSAFEDCEYFGGTSPESDTRVTLRGTSIAGSTATVRVAISAGYNGGVFDEPYEEDAEFTLRRTGGEWLVTAAPWQFDLCELEDAR